MPHGMVKNTKHLQSYFQKNIWVVVEENRTYGWKPSWLEKCKSGKCVGAFCLYCSRSQQDIGDMSQGITEEFLCMLFKKEVSIYRGLGRVRRRNGNPLQDSCLENPIDGGAWKGAVHGVAKSQTWLSYFTFIFHFPALEKEMATHSSVLTWRIPGTGEPGGLPSMRSHSRTWLKRLSSSRSSSGKG